MGKSKKRSLEEREATGASEAADLPTPPAHRPAPEPWATSNDNARWSLHMASVPITVEGPNGAGITSKVANTLDTTGAPEMHPSLVSRLDRHAMRPSFEGYLRFHFKDDWRLRLFLPLCLAEAQALLQARDSRLSFAFNQVEPTGDLNLTEAAQIAQVTPATIRERKAKAEGLMRQWLDGASCNMPSVQKSKRTGFYRETTGRKGVI